MTEIEFHEQILSEDEIRLRMSELSTRFPKERQTLRVAYANLAKAEAKAHLAITFQEVHLLKNPSAQKYLSTSKADGIKLTVGDKEHLLALELEELKIAYDLAKYDCETTEKDFSKLQPQLSFYQSVLKNGGSNNLPTEPENEDANEIAEF